MWTREPKSRRNRRRPSIQQQSRKRQTRSWGYQASDRRRGAINGGVSVRQSSQGQSRYGGDRAAALTGWFLASGKDERDLETESFALIRSPFLTKTFAL